MRVLQDLQVVIEMSRLELSTEAFAAAVAQNGSRGLETLTAANAKVAVVIPSADSRRLVAAIRQSGTNDQKVKLSYFHRQSAERLMKDDFTGHFPTDSDISPYGSR
ncbi:MAG: hypothetical protein NT069_13420 [Planctomycetota bacterium]|nr:hypothetical protein [Planctomycetota bacterium]